MVEALTLDGLREQVKERYDRDEHRVVGIMMARYNISVAKDIIEQNYPYWHLNTGKRFDVFWAGYGKYLSPSNESSTKTILTFPGNTEEVYFDLAAFIEIKEQFTKYFGSYYEDKLQLILVNYHDGELCFNESLKIDLEKSHDDNYAKIREIMEFVSNECSAADTVVPIARKLTAKKVKKIFSGITLSDAINACLGIGALIR